MAPRTLQALVAVAALALRGAAHAQPADDDPFGEPFDDAIADSIHPADERLPPRARLQLGSKRFRHPSIVVELALSPDQQSLVALGSSAPLIVLDAATGRERWRDNSTTGDLSLSAASYGTHAIAFVPGTQRFYTPAGPDTIYEWDARSGNRDGIAIGDAAAADPNPFDGDAGSSRSIDVSPDGQRLAVGNAMRLVVCDLTGKIQYEIANAAAGVPGANEDRLWFSGHFSYGRFSPDGKTLAVVLSSAPKELRLHDAPTGAELRRIALAGNLVRMEYSPDSQQLVATERDSSVRAYRVADGERVWEHTVPLDNPYENYTSAIAYAPDGRSVAFAATDNKLRLLDAATGAEQAVLAGHNQYPWTLAFNREGSILYSSGWEGTIRRWDLTTREQLPLPEGVRATGIVTFAPNGEYLAYADDAGVVRVVDATTGEEQRQFAVEGGQFSQLKFTPDCRRLAGGGSRGEQVLVAIWDVASGEVVRQWEWPKGRDPHSDIEALSFTPDGARLAAACFRQDKAFLWDVEANRQVAAIDHQEVYGLSISPDGATLATAGWDSKVRLWAVADGAALKEVDVTQHRPARDPVNPHLAGFVDDDLRMYSVEFSPLGDAFVTQHMNGKLWIWTADGSSMVREMATNGGAHHGTISFSPDGLWVAYGTSQGLVQMWDTLTGEEAWKCFQSHQDGVYTTSFGGDSYTLVSGGSDGVCYVWDLRPTISAAEWTAEERFFLWEQLSDKEGEWAHQAMAQLAAQPDQAIELIVEQLAGVDMLLDPNLVEAGALPEETERAQALRRKLIAEDSSVEHVLAARRALALLFGLRTSAARQVLEELAAGDPEGDVGKLATAMLARWE